MAVAKDHLLSLGYFTATDRNTFTIQKDHALKKSREMRLQQRWYELRERELMAKQHNKELLQQFDEAQNELKEMLIQTAAMKTLRMEYEGYLGENYPHWQQQLKEKTQAAQTKRIEECLKTRLKNSDLGKTPTHISAPQDFDHSQDGSSYRRLMRSSWLTQSPSQTALSPNGVPIQPQDLSHVPPLFLKPPVFPHLQPFQQQHLSPSPHHHPLPQQGPPSGWASHHPDYPWFRAAAAGGPSGSEALLGQFFVDEPPLESRVSVTVREEADASRAVNSTRERGGDNRSGHLSEELDVKPVRLSSGQAQSSESSRESSRGSREKRKMRRRRTEMNPDGESRSSQESSQASSAAVVVSAAESKSSESDVGENSSRRMTRREGLAVESPKMLKTEQSKESDSGSNNTESGPSAEESGSQSEGSMSEKAEAQSPVDNSESSTEESGSQREELAGKMSMKPKNEATDEKGKQESSSSGQSSEEDKDEEEEDHENNLGNEDVAEEKESSPRDEEQDEDDDDDGEGSARKNITGEEEAPGAEDEESDDQEDDEDDEGSEDGRKESSSSQGEDENEGSEEKMEGEGSDGEEQRSNKGGVEEERDSDDIIISPQENRYKKIHVIPEEAAEDERKEENIMPSSDDEDDGDEGSDEHSEDDDIELLLVPPDKTQKKEEMEPKADEKHKVCDMVQRFHVDYKDQSIKSDSDEFDHFYD